MITVSLVIPCYNEEALIEDTLKKIIGFFRTEKYGYEIIVCDDGSEDSTVSIVKGISRSNPCIKIFTGSGNRGKGAVLTEGMTLATGDIITFIDADLEIDISYLSPIIRSIEEGSDIAIGCKVMHSEWQKRAVLRRLATRGYNMLVRIMLGSEILDHQAGIKGFKKSAIKDILKDVRAYDWTWDTEVLIYAQRRGYNITEVPVGTSFRRSSKLNIYIKPFGMAKDVFRLYLKGVRVR